MTVAGTQVPAGSRRVVRVPVAHDVTGPVEVVTHAVAGAHDGPTLLLLSMLHGNEWFSMLIIRELLAGLDPATLRGNVLAVPVANAPALVTNTRCIQDNADEPDANRTFGGPYQWLSNQISRAIGDHLISQSHAIIDYHVGDWGATMADVSYVTDFGERRRVRAEPRDGALLRLSGRARAHHSHRTARAADLARIRGRAVRRCPGLSPRWAAWGLARRRSARGSSRTSPARWA